MNATLTLTGPTNLTTALRPSYRSWARETRARLRCPGVLSPPWPGSPHLSMHRLWSAATVDLWNGSASMMLAP